MARLICFDMDGVIFRPTNVWMEAHRAFGTYEEGRELTAKYVHADYARLVEEVVGRLWKGRDAAPFLSLIGSIPYLPGVEETFAELKGRGYTTAIISGSSLLLARRAQEDLSIDFIYANELVIEDGIVTGAFRWPVAGDPEKKLAVLKGLVAELGTTLADTVYVGDDAIDIAVFREVGTSVAFNSHSKDLKRLATHVVESDDLRKVLPLIPHS
ncbi:HAD family phosphatase [Candidatus Woesearchaeota archaeon]|nr:HAD family phosphatase [Candidatus Woesearchaeota archaeon]